MYYLGRTNTFRAASGAVLDTYGSNMQNISKEIRKIYLPDDGYKFLQPDQAGAEALIVAFIARAGKFRELFQYGIKPHTYVALHLFKDDWKKEGKHLDIDGLCLLPVNQLTTHPQWKEVNNLIKGSDDWPAFKRFYYMAKQTCHSANYGIRAPTFRLNTLEKSDGKVALSLQQAEYFLSFYRDMFPEIVEWNIETREQVSRTKVLRNLFGHPREFFTIQTESHYQEAYAFVPQSTVGEITHKAFRDLQTYIEDNGKDWDVLQNNHDSYLCQCKPEEEQDCGKMMVKFLEQDLVGRGGVKFKMRSELSSGYNWAPYKKESNENGLRELKLL